MIIFSKEFLECLGEFQTANERLIAYEQQLDDLQRKYEKIVREEFVR